MPRRVWWAIPLLLIVAGLAWYGVLFSGFTLHGTIVDGTTGSIVPGVRAAADNGAIVSVDASALAVERFKSPLTIAATAPGYRSISVRVTSPFEPLSLSLDPIAVEVEAFDTATGLPVVASLNGSPATTRSRIAPVTDGQTFNVTAVGYVAADARYSGQELLRVPLVPRLDGRVTDRETGQPVAAARIAVDGQVMSTDAQGIYHLGRRPTAGVLSVLRPGYRRATLDLSSAGGLDLTLEPLTVRATYMTYFAIGGQDYLQDMYRLLDTTEINSVVIDVKGDYGLLSYKSAVPLAQQIGANDAPTIDNLDALLTELHARRAYAIARIVVFKDTVLARNGSRAGLDVGVRDRRTGRQWVDGEDLAWVDPFQSAAWDYNAALAREAIERGFDEVQFDYIRFPTDPSPDSSVNDIVYSRESTEANRVGALKTFLGQAHQAVNDAGGFLSIDTFGYTTWWDDDGGIGQDLAVLADDIDYYSPMVYPSTFNAGVPGHIGYPAVVGRPYETVYLSLKHVQEKLAGRRVLVRPWLQYFDDYPWATKTRYDAPQIEAQKKAVVDSNSSGWLLWHPGSLFKRGGIARKP